jgi:hypothetical protein
MMINILKKLLGAFFALTAFVLLFVLALLQWPSILLNEPMINWAKRQWNSGERTLQVGWSRLELEVEGRGILANRLLFRIDDFCFELEQGSGCFAHFEAGLAYEAGRLALSEIGPLRALEGEVRYSYDPEADPFELPEVPDWIKDAEIRPLQAELRRYEAKVGEETLIGRASLRSSRENGDREDEKRIQLEIKDRQFGEAELTGISRSRKVRGPWSAEGVGDLRLPGRARLLSRFSLEPREVGHVYRLSADYRSPQAGGKIETEGSIEDGRVEGRLDGVVSVPLDIALRTCSYSYAPDETTARMEATCPFFAQLDRLDSPVQEALGRLELERSVGGTIRAEILGAHPPSAAEPLRGTVRFEPHSSMGPAIAGSGFAEANFALVPERLPDLEELEATLNLRFVLPDFQQLVSALDDSPFPVPAPLNALGGHLILTAAGKVTESGGSIRTHLRSRLSSRHQRLFADGAGSIELKSLSPEDLSARMKISLNQVRIALPPVGLDPPELLLPDPRIRAASLAEIEEAEPFPFSYALTVTSPRPMELLSEFSPKPIPVTVDLRATDEVTLVGSIEVDEFPLEVLGVRRRFEGAEIFVRLTERQQVVAGEVSVPGVEDPVEVLHAERPGEPLLHPFPQLPLSLAEILSGIALEFPVSLAVVGTRIPLAPQTQPLEEPTSLQLRRRW